MKISRHPFILFPTLPISLVASSKFFHTGGRTTPRTLLQRRSYFFHNLLSHVPETILRYEHIAISNRVRFEYYSGKYCSQIEQRSRRTLQQRYTAYSPGMYARDARFRPRRPFVGLIAKPSGWLWKIPSTRKIFMPSLATEGLATCGTCSRIHIQACDLSCFSLALSLG